MIFCLPFRSTQGGSIRVGLAAFLSGLLCFAIPAFAADTPKTPEATRFTLENGLKVEIIEQHRAPAVAHILWVDTGAADDPRGKSGLSHYLEHLLFKGTATLSEEKYNLEIERLGGEHNAFTNYDVTAYYVLVAKEHLKEVMALESERFLHWHPKDDGYAAERDVIVEERRLRTENQPGALLSEAMDAALFRNHPYHTPVIGWMHEMEGLSPQDAKDWFVRYYQPKNATLMLVGDVTPAEGRKLAERYFAGWKNTAELPKRDWAGEPPRLASERLVLRMKSVQQPVWRREYVAPSLVYGETKQAVPLMLLAEVLGADRTGILYRKLVKEAKVATAVDTGYGGFSRGPETFTISIAPAPGVTLDKVGAAYDKALDEALAENAITETEVARARTQIKAQTIFARDGLEGYAFLVAQLRMLGLPAEYFTALTKTIDRVGPEAVRQAGISVLKQPAVTGWLLPEDRDVATKAVQSLKTEGDAGAVH